MKILFLFFILPFIFTSCSRPLEDKQLKKNKDNLEIVLEGVVLPNREVAILAPIMGEIENIYIKNGSYIKKNENIIGYNHLSFNRNIYRIKSKISQKRFLLRKMKLSKNQIDIYNSKENLKNITYLSNLGISTKPELYEAQNRYIASLERKDSLNSRIDALKFDIVLLKYELQDARNIYNNSIIKSPINGFVKELAVTKGQRVDVNSILGKVINIDNVVVKAGLASGLLPYISEGQPVKIKFLTTPRKNIEANISKIIPILDPTFGKIVVEIELKNKDFSLQPKTKALITIKLPKGKNLKEFY